MNDPWAYLVLRVLMKIIQDDNIVMNTWTTGP